MDLRLSTPRYFMPFLAGLAVLMSMSVRAAPPATPAHPDPRVQKYLADNESAIAALSKRAIAVELPASDRNAAMKELGLISEDAAIRARGVLREIRGPLGLREK